MCYITDSGVDQQPLTHSLELYNDMYLLLSTRLVTMQLRRNVLCNIRVKDIHNSSHRLNFLHLPLTGVSPTGSKQWSN